MKEHIYIFKFPLLILVFVGGVVFFAPHAFADSAGPNRGDTFASNSGNGGDIAWSNPSRATSTNDSYATANLSSVGFLSRYLKVTGFFVTSSIPSDATVNGIQVEIEKKASVSSALEDTEVFLVKGGIVESGENKAELGVSWGTSDGYSTYGGISDLWSTTWTASDINSTGFGVVISATAVSDAATASIDHVRITVYYTPAVAATVTISGTVYSDEGVTTTTSTVKVAVDGTTVSSTASAANGTYSVTMTTPSSTAIITAWMTNNGSGAVKSTYSGSGNMSGLNIYKNRLIATGSLTNANIGVCDKTTGAVCADSNMNFDVSGSALTIDSGSKIVVPSGRTFTPGGNVTTPAIEVTGTFALGSNTLKLTAGGSGSTCTAAADTMMPLCVNGGSFSGSGSTVLYTGTSSVTLTASTTYPGALTVSSTGVTFSLNGATTITGNLTVTAGTLSGASNLTVSGGTLSGAGTVSLTSGTTTLSGAGTIGGGTYTFYNLSLSGASSVTTSTGNTTVSNALTVGSSHTLNASSTTWTFNGGSGNVFVLSGTFVAASSTFNFAGSSTTINTASTTFWNVGFGTTADAVAATYMLGADIAVQNTLTLGSAGSSAMDTLSPGPYNIILTAAGTPIATSTWGQFSNTTGTVTYAGASAQNVVATTYYNLQTNPTGAITQTLGTASGQTITVKGNLIFGTAAAGSTAVIQAATYNPNIAMTGNVTLGSCLKQEACAGSITYTKGTGTWQFSGVSTQTVTDSDLTKQDIGIVSISATQVNLGSNIVAESISLSGPSTLSFNGGSWVLTLTGTGAPFSSTGSLEPGGGTVSYTGTTNPVTVAGKTYYNLSIGASASSTRYTLSGTASASGTLSIAQSSGTNTFDAGSADSSMTLSANSGSPFSISASEVFVASSSTFIYTGSGVTITSTTYNNLTVNSAGTATFGGATTINGTFNVAAGTASTSEAITALGDVTGAGIIYATGTNTFIASGTAQFGGTGNWSFTDLTFNGVGSVTTATSTGSVTIYDVLTVGTSHTLNAGPKTWRLKGTNANPFTQNGTLSPASSTFIYESIPATSIVFLESLGNDVAFNNMIASSSGKTLQPNSANTSLSGDLTIMSGSTFKAAASPIRLNIGGSFTNSGTFTHNSATITFNASSTGKTINPGTSAFYNVTFNSPTGGWSFTTGTTITNDLAMNAGTLSGEGVDVAVNGGDVTGDGVFSFSGNGTFTVSGAGSFGGASDWTFSSLTFSGSSQTTTSTSSGNISVGGLTVSSGHTLYAGSKTWIIDGTATPTFTGTFSPASSTVSYRPGASPVTIATTTYYNLSLDGVSNSLSQFSVDGALTMNNNLTVSTGTFSNTYNVTVLGGSVMGNGVIDFTAGTTTLSGTGNFGGTNNWKFYNLAFGSGSVGTTTASSTGNIRVDNVLTIVSNASLNAGAKTWTLYRNGGTLFNLLGTFIPQTSTVHYAGGGSSAVTIASSSYYNLFIGSTTLTTPFYFNGNVTVNGNLVLATSTGANTLNGSSTVITLAGSGHPFNVANGNAVWNYGTSKVRYTATSPVTLGTTYYNLDVGTDPDAVGTTYTLGANTTVNNVLTIGDPASSAVDTLDGSGYTLTLAGTTAPMEVTSQGGFSGGTGTVQYTGNGTTNVSASSSITYNNLQIIPGAGQTHYIGTGAGQTLTVNGNLDLAFDNTSITVDASNNNPNITVKGNLTVGACVSGAGCASQMTFTKGSGTLTFSPAGTVTLTDNNSTKQNIGAVSISGGSATPTVNMGSSITADSLSVAGSHVFGVGGNTLTLQGTGTAFSNSGTFNAGTSTVVFTGAGGTTIGAATFYDLQVKPGANSVTHALGAGTLVVGHNLTLGNGTNTGVIISADTNNTTLNVTGNVTVAANTTFQANASNETAVGGDWTNNGTFTHNSGTVNLNGSALQTISGTLTGSSAFSTIRVTNNSGSDAQTSPSVSFANSTTASTSTFVTASSKLKFLAGGTFTSANINWNGQASTSRVSVRSSSAGSQWNLVVSGSQTVRSVDAKDSNACSGDTIDATYLTNSNSGNNNCWTFPSSVFATSGTIYSHIIDTQVQGGAAPNSIQWLGTQPVGTSVKFQIAASNSSSTDSSNWSFVAWNSSACDASSYYDPGAPGRWVEIKAQCHENQRYFRWKALLQTSDTATSAIVTDVILNYAR